MTDDEIINWFDENYSEDKKTIIKMLNLSILNHPCTLALIYESCIELTKITKKKISLVNILKCVARLSDYGITGKKAGEHLIIFFNLIYIFRKDLAS